MSREEKDYQLFVNKKEELPLERNHHQVSDEA
jgi:hypothetical protein